MKKVTFLKKLTPKGETPKFTKLRRVKMIRKTLQKTCPECGQGFFTQPNGGKKLCEKCYQKAAWLKRKNDAGYMERHKAYSRKYLHTDRGQLQALKRRFKKRIQALNEIVKLADEIGKLERKIKSG